MPLPRRVQLFVLAVLLLMLFSVRGLNPPSPTVRHTFGRGPEIVLVHGLGSSGSHWLPVARLLARRYRVTMIDLPGHGLASMPTPFSLEQATLALDRALAEGGDEPVILVGHSLGGLVAAAEALRSPRRVRGLILIETALKPQVPESQRAALLAELDRDYENFVHEAYRGFGRDSAQGERLWREVAQLDPAMVKPWIRLAFIADLSGQIRDLLPPLYAVLAERSWPRDEPWSEVAAELGYEGVPQMRVKRLEGCGHFPMIDRPEDVARLIERFADHPAGEPIADR